MNKIGVNGENDLLVTNEINGDTFAVVTKGKNIEKRIITAIQEEFDFEILDVFDIVKHSETHINFSVNTIDNDMQSIELLRAFIY